MPVGTNGYQMTHTDLAHGVVPSREGLGMVTGLDFIGSTLPNPMPAHHAVAEIPPMTSEGLYSMMYKPEENRDAWPIPMERFDIPYSLPERPGIPPSMAKQNDEGLTFVDPDGSKDPSVGVTTTPDGRKLYYRPSAHTQGYTYMGDGRGPSGDPAPVLCQQAIRSIDRPGWDAYPTPARPDMAYTTPYRSMAIEGSIFPKPAIKADAFGV